MSLGDDSLSQLYSVMQIYEEKESAEQSFKSAKSLFDKGHYVKTQEACEKLSALEPNNVNIILLWSASFFMQGKYDQSLECLHKVPEEYRECVEVLNNLAANHLQQNRYSEACNEYHSAVCKKVDFIECLLSFIVTLIKMKNYKAAINGLKMIIFYDPDLYKPYIFYGQLLIKLNRFDEARSKFQAAIKLQPKSDVSWAGLGDSFAYNKNFYSAIMCYETAIEINKSLMEPLINLGLMYYKVKRFDKSISILKTAIQMYPMKMSDLLPTLANAYLYKGDSSLARAYTLYLKNNSNNPVVLFDMGVKYLTHVGNAAAAEQCFKLCVDLDERNVLYHEYLYSAYVKLDKKDFAFKTAIKWAKAYMLKNDSPGMIMALNTASDLLTDNDHSHWKLESTLKFDIEDLLRYADAKKLKSHFFLTFSNIEFINEEENRPEDAEQLYEKALQLNPKQRKGLIDDVIGLYERMLKYCISDSFVIHKRLANIFYKDVGNYKEAYNHFLKASEFCDTDFETYLFLGIVSLELSNNFNAIHYFLKVLELNPDCIVAHVYIGYIYKEWKQFNQAINEFEKVLNLQPNRPDAYDLLIQCQRHTCKFINLDEMHVNKLKNIVFQELTNNEVPSVKLPHSLLCNFEPEVLKQIASTFAKQYVDKPYVQRSSGYVHNISLSNGCIRVGYIYTDCSTHPTSELVKSIRKLHDRNKFEVFSYSLSPINRFRSNNLSASDCCVDISNLSSIDAANKINADGIHILIDVGNSTKDLEYEIFVLKPAPIQVKLLGHPGTSGATFIDYLITDEKCSPPELDCLYTEKLAYLNRTVFFGAHGLLFNDLSQRNPQNRNTNKNNSNETMGIIENYNTMPMYSIQIFPDYSIKCYTREMYNLPKYSIVYCYFGQLYKINQTTLNMWISILKNVNNSVLWLLRFVKEAENNIHEYVAMNGIDPVRVIFSNIAPKDEHLRRIQLADIFLDTPLYNGHTSCLDALWAGTPIVTLSGDTFASRMATSQLTALNCTETIALTENDYTRIAIKLGTHTHILDQIRQKIWHSRTTSELFDCKSYCNRLENLYLEMWNKLINQCI